MNNLIFVICGFIIIWGLYKVFTFIHFRRLKNILNGTDIDAFKKMLGNKYQYKTLSNGLLRCKWSNWLIIVKANFNEEGKLICRRIKPYNIFRLKSEILFKA